MRNLAQTRMQAAMELLEHKAKKALKDEREHFVLSREDVNEILVVAGADTIETEKELEVIEV